MLTEKGKTMKLKDWIPIIIYILIMIGCVALSIWLTIAIVNSNMPLWLKIILLR